MGKNSAAWTQNFSKRSKPVREEVHSESIVVDVSDSDSSDHDVVCIDIRD
jgi:hypothetical protein